jgi:hypothetical protein
MGLVVRLVVLFFLSALQILSAQPPTDFPAGQTGLVLLGNSCNRDVAVRVYFPK